MLGLRGCSLGEKLIFGNKMSKHPPRERGSFDCGVNHGASARVIFSYKTRDLGILVESNLLLAERWGLLLERWGGRVPYSRLRLEPEELG